MSRIQTPDHWGCDYYLILAIVGIVGALFLGSYLNGLR